jgi:hypothetical protein
MIEVTLKFWRVRFYNVSGQVTYSARVMADSEEEARDKFREHFGIAHSGLGLAKIRVFPAGRTTVYK